MHTVTVKVGVKSIVLTHPNVGKLLTFDFQYMFDKLWERAVKRQAHDPEWYEKLVSDFTAQVNAEGFQPTTQRTIQLY